jgi:DNA (cytosine-5)-methyltransferase 1
MKYLSFFSGIGGFELAISRYIPNSECVGYSEISSDALKIYQHHFPTHKNLGDITSLSNRRLSNYQVDLVVAGFPCTNLTPMARFVKGEFPVDTFREGESGLFYHLLRILHYLGKRNPQLHIIIENNASMNHENRDSITALLNNVLKNNVIINTLDNATFAVQTRRRHFWTTFPLTLPRKLNQVWSDVLDDFSSSKIKLAPQEFYNKLILSSDTQKEIKIKTHVDHTQSFYFGDRGKTRFNVFYPSDTTDQLTEFYPSYPIGKSRPILSCKNYVIDRRFGKNNCFLFRKFTIVEIERLFGYPDNYTQGLSETARVSVLGKTVSQFTVGYVVQCFANIDISASKGDY